MCESVTSESSQSADVVSHVTSYSQGLFHLQIGFTGRTPTGHVKEGIYRESETEQTAVLHSPV